MSFTATKAARQALIKDLIQEEGISTQTELCIALADRGINVTQPTLSKDLLAIGAIRRRGPEGDAHYVIDDRLVNQTKLPNSVLDLVVSVAASGNVVILKTPSGAANFFASFLDRLRWSEILGTIAGDDTIAIYTAAIDGAEALKAKLEEMKAQGGKNG